MLVHLPNEDGFNRCNNSYSKERYSSICREYGVNINAIFRRQSSRSSKINGIWWPTVDEDYAQWIIPSSKGLSEQGLIKFPEECAIICKTAIRWSITS